MSVSFDAIRWDSGLPEEVWSAFEPLLRVWWPLIPTWVQEFSVHWDGRSQSRMWSRINYRNRWAAFYVTPGWLGDSEQERVQTIRHEILHVSLAPLQDAFENIMETLDEDSAFGKLAKSTYENAVESSVEDLARGIARQLAKGDET